MSKGLVPSEIVQSIDQYFPKTQDFQNRSDHSDFVIAPEYLAVLAAFVEMVDDLDQALLPADAEGLADLRIATGYLRFHTRKGAGILRFIPGSRRRWLPSS